MKKTRVLLRLWYALAEDTDKDVKASLVTQAMDENPELMYKVVCMFYLDGKGPLDLKAWICHKDFYGDLAKCANNFDLLSEENRKDLARDFARQVCYKYAVYDYKMPDDSLHM